MLKNWISSAFSNQQRATQKNRRIAPDQRLRLQLEELESRTLLSGSPPIPILLPVVPHQPVTTSAPTNVTPPTVPGSTILCHTDHIVVVHGPNGFTPAANPVADGTPSPDGQGFIPSQIESAYGINAIKFGSIVGNGAGQTIAIVDAYDNPKMVSSTDANFANSDLHQFDLEFGLPEPAGFFSKVNQTGGSTPPAVDAGWCTEIDLDVEWAHALAPQAKIILVEANSATDSDLFAGAVNYARTIPSVSVVSMSFGGLDDLGEPSQDQYFTTPAGHQPITFLAATGDYGAQGGYPAYSPNVVAVGGTQLTLTSSNTYASEIGWGDGLTYAQGSSGGSGGGISNVYQEPSYQQILTPTTTYGNNRTIPDVSFDASPYSPVVVYDSYNNGSQSITSPLSTTAWGGVGGTSFACPAWAAQIAIANQGRTLFGLSTLDGVKDTLQKLYTLGYNQYKLGTATDFHDITSGNNGYPAGPGYDLVTGIGSPISNVLIPALVNTPATHFSVVSSVSSTTAGTSFTVTVSALDKLNNVIPDYTGTVHFTSTDPTASLPANYTFTGANGGVHTFSVTLYHTGNQTITVVDISNAARGTTTVAVTPGAATHFSESGAQYNLLFTMVVTALDAYGNVATGFTGKVNFSSPNANNMPPSYTFQTSDNGVHSFTMSLANLGYGVYDVYISSAGLQTFDGKEWKLYGHTHP